MTEHALIASRLHDGEAFLAETALVIGNGVVRAVLDPATLPAAMPVRRLPEGSMLAPGFLDLQVNGGGDLLLNDVPERAGLAAIAAAHRRRGTTGILPTLISGSRELMRRALAATAEAIAACMPGILGLHIEGPFINPSRRGIHPAGFLLTLTEDDIALLSGPRGFPLMLTLAPEQAPPGAVARLAEAGVIVFAGHSDATAEAIGAALDAGLAGFTHLFNAMSQLASRAPGVVGAALAAREAWAGIIADGLHVHPAALAAAYAAKGPGRLFLVSDAMSTVGGSATGFTLGGVPITLSNGKLTGPDGTLAGAHLDMATAVRRAVALGGIPLADALRMATATPADCLGLARVGRLRPGCRADVLALDAALNVTEIWLAGEPYPMAR